MSTQLSFDPAQWEEATADSPKADEGTAKSRNAPLWDRHIAALDSNNAVANARVDSPESGVGQAEVSKLAMPVSVAPYKFQALKRWEGVIVGLNGSDFVARLQSLDNSNEWRIEAVIGLEEVTDADRDLVVPGAVFYWTIGYRIESYGQKSSVSTLRFRRLPTWTASDLNRIKAAASRYDALFDESTS